MYTCGVLVKVCVRARILIMMVVVVRSSWRGIRFPSWCVCVCVGYLWRLSVPGVHKFGCMVSP